MSNMLSRISESNSTRSDPQPQPMAPSPVLMTLQEVWEMAGYVVAARCFPVKTQEQAFTLFMLAQSKGLHPMAALERYHLMEIGGRVTVTMRADALGAMFLARGGRFEVTERSEHRAAAIFSHPHLTQPKEFEYTMEDARKAGDIKNNQYQLRPKAMLWARLISTVVNMVDPGVRNGIMTDVEAEDAALETPQAVTERSASPVRSIEPRQPTAANVDTMKLPGQHGADGFDGREYRQVVQDALASVNAELMAVEAEILKPPEIHRHLCLRAINAGHHIGPPPATANAAIPIIIRLYRDQREWVRRELGLFLLEQVETAREEARLREEVKQEEPSQNEEGNPEGELPDEPGMRG